MYAAMLINICHVGEDGKTAYERRRGKKFKRELPEFGESVWYLKPGTAGKDELDEDIIKEAKMLIRLTKKKIIQGDSLKLIFFMLLLLDN